MYGILVITINILALLMIYEFVKFTVKVYNVISEWSLNIYIYFYIINLNEVLNSYVTTTTDVSVSISKVESRKIGTVFGWNVSIQRVFFFFNPLCQFKGLIHVYYIELTSFFAWSSKFVLRWVILGQTLFYTFCSNF